MTPEEVVSLLRSCCIATANVMKTAYHSSERMQRAAEKREDAAYAKAFETIIGRKPTPAELATMTG